MKVSEWKLENSVIVNDENYEFLSDIELFTKSELVKGSKFVDALLDEPGSPFDNTSVYFMDSEIDLFDITVDPDWDDEVGVSEQKFKVKLKA
jgi:hypothetical protein